MNRPEQIKHLINEYRGIKKCLYDLGVLILKTQEQIDKNRTWIKAGYQAIASDNPNKDALAKGVRDGEESTVMLLHTLSSLREQYSISMKIKRELILKMRHLFPEADPHNKRGNKDG